VSIGVAEAFIAYVLSPTFQDVSTGLFSRGPRQETEEIEEEEVETRPECRDITETENKYGTVTNIYRTRERVKNENKSKQFQDMLW
jgi:hypothetical protein